MLGVPSPAAAGSPECQGLRAQAVGQEALSKGAAAMWLQSAFARRQAELVSARSSDFSREA